MDGPRLLGGDIITRLSDPRWRVVGAGDADRDGITDIFWRHLDTGQLALWKMGSWELNHVMLRDGQLIYPVVSDLNWVVAGVNDLNNDGRADVMWQNIRTGALAVWFMDGARLVDGMMLPIAVGDRGWRIVSVTDFNRDRRPDFLWQHADGRLAFWHMNGTQVLESVMIHVAAPLNHELAAVVDVDGDLSLDFIWQDNTTGVRTVWFMTQRTRRTIRPYGGPVAEPGWKPVGPR